MQIEIDIPIFKCKEDQKVFLSRLSGLPNFAKLDADDCKYLLTLTASNVEMAIQELQKISYMWGTTFSRISE